MTRETLFSSALRRIQSPKTEVPCLGVALGRRSLWAAGAPGSKGRGSQGWPGKSSWGEDLFPNRPAGPLPDLALAAAPLGEKFRNSFVELQLALPDPAVRFEALALENLPARGKPLQDFLTWRFNQDKNPAAPALSFTTQVLGEEEGKALLLVLAVEQMRLRALEGAFQALGLYPSVVDMALGYRFNFFQDALRGGGEGAMVALEPDYWSLVVWDQALRPRFVRSKWWEGEKTRAKELPLEEMVLEVERTIHSYVYTGKNRNVESIFVSAPEDWLGPAHKALNRKCGGKCRALSLPDSKGLPEGFPPTALAAAVRR